MKKWFLHIYLLLPLLGLSQDWEPDFDRALARSVKEDKPLIVVFTGSDWCAPCIKLDRAIWQSDLFKAYASNHFVLYRADFPKKKKNQLPPATLAKNKALAQAYNSKGYFPLVVVLDKDRSVLGTAGYEKVGPKKYIELLASFVP